MDQSAIECVNKLTERYLKQGKNIHLRHLSSDCVKLIKKAEKICDVNVLEDPDYFVAIDNFRQAQNSFKSLRIAYSINSAFKSAISSSKDFICSVNIVMLFYRIKCF